MDERHLFLELADGVPLSRLARRTGLARSTIVRRLKRLETRLGMPLLRHVGRRVTVTERGQRYAQGLAPLLRSLDRFEEAAASEAGQLRGAVRLWLPAFGAGEGLAPSIARFTQRHPEVVVHMTLGRDLRTVRPDQVDVALAFGRGGPPDLRTRTLWHEQTVLVAHTDYLARHGTPTRLDDLAQHRGVHQRDLLDVPVHWLTADGERVPMPPPVAVVSGPSLAYALVRAGAGIGRVPRLLARDDLAAGRVQQVLPEVTTTAPVRFLYAPDPSPAARALMDAVTEDASRAGPQRPWS